MFFYRISISIDFTSVNWLSCISMTNQECRIRPPIVNVNGNDPVFFPFSIKISKCSGSSNNINNLYAKLCAPDVVTNLNVRAFNLMSRTNEIRHKEWHETCKCKCRLDASVCNNKQRWKDDKCICKCKELIDKDVCDKGFTWNPSNCECQYYKSCDFSEYLDYKNCKCTKKLVDKLADECTENIAETRLVEITSTECNSIENKRRHNSRTLYIVLLSIIFLISIVISGFFYC